jgi:anaerobic dimethyl sulfoxide reductase subunit B (iron-sulfur subunit)
MTIMAKQLGFYLELDRCIGCRSCEIACKQWHGLEPKVAGETGPRWRRVIRTESGTFPNVKVINLSLACMHCAKPPCEAVCPTGAIIKRAEDGIVVVDRDKCIGCYYCFSACPFGIPQFDEDGIMQKCDFCLDRLEQGQKPVCELTCTAEALHTGTMEELSELAARKTAQKLAGLSQPSFIQSSITGLSS